MGDIKRWACGLSQAKEVEVPEYVYGEGRGLFEGSRWSLSECGGESAEFEKYDRGAVGPWGLKTNRLEGPLKHG